MINIGRDFVVATLLKSEMVAEDVKSLTFSIAGWPGHVPGQHCEIRLTAPDGYQASREYSIASPPEQATLDFGIQLMQNGEVSPYLFAIQPGEQVEIKGPLGGHFVWTTETSGPLFLIGGGSGTVPLMSMVRHAKNAQDTRPLVFLISARTLSHVLYYEELLELQKQMPNLHLAITLTDGAPDRWPGYTRRIDQAMLTEVFGPYNQNNPTAYICGPTLFVEASAEELLAIGLSAAQIKTERFGGASTPPSQPKPPLAAV